MESCSATTNSTKPNESRKYTGSARNFIQFVECNNSISHNSIIKNRHVYGIFTIYSGTFGGLGLPMLAFGNNSKRKYECRTP